MYRHITRLIALSLFILTVSVSTISAQNDDGIPDNCQHQYAQHYRPNIFTRYEPQNRRLMLVDWNTGADVGVLATDLDDTIIRSWSPTCRYLAVTVTHAESRETNVYDTLDLRLMGSVPNTPSVLNPVSWGPGEFLVVEGRAGAVLWNVPHNTQFTLDAGYSPITSRNFNRLRWDADKGQLTANFAVGGRAIYDLNTGQAINVTTTRPGEVVFGGETFACVPTRSARGGATVSGLWLEYAMDGGVVYLGRGGSETLATIEANVSLTLLSQIGWSTNCRYIAAALGSTQQEDTYDTVIWDVLENRRVGTFLDARGVSHQLTWDTAEKHVLVETRDGAYLWNLETDARILVSTETKRQTIGCYYGGCRTYNFERVYWDAGRQQMLGVPVESFNAVIAYDVNTGAEVTRYTVEGAQSSLDFITSNDSKLLVAYTDGQMHVWNRENGALTTVSLPDKLGTYDTFSSRSAISNDNHFLVSGSSSKLWVYDLTTLNANSVPIHTYASLDGYFSWGVHFINGDTLASNYTYSQRRINVVTGERFGAAIVIDPQAQPVQNYTAIPGSSGQSARYRYERCEQSPRYDRDTRQLIVTDTQNTNRVIETDLNPFYSLGISPDCATIYGKVYRMNRSLPYDTTPPTRYYGYEDATQMIFWDVLTGERLVQFDNRSGAGAVWWNPDGNRAFIDMGYTGQYIVHPASRTLLPVRFQDTDAGSIPSLHNAYWDHSRGVIFIEGYGEVFAIDIQTGVERLRFPALESGRGGCYHSHACGMSFSQDNNWVFVYGDHTLSAWNIDTLTNVTIPVENSKVLSYGAQISPDGHFLIVSRSAVRVWDLHNLPETFEDRLPLMTFGVGADAVISVKFVDNQTIEVVRRAASGEGTETVRYDVLTGAPVA